MSLPKAAVDAARPAKSGPFGYPGRDTLPAGVGNKAIALKNCRGVLFRDFTIYHGGHFGILANGVDNWTCDNQRPDRPHQVRHRVERRLSQHHDLELRV